MLEAARVLAGFGAIMLLAAGVFWIKFARGHQVHRGEILLSSNVERGSQLLVLAVALSAAAASLAIVGLIAM